MVLASQRRQSPLPDPIPPGGGASLRRPSLLATEAGAAVINKGTITVKEAGFAALVAPSVRNEGVIQARLGTVILAAGEAFTLDLYGDDLISFEIGPSAPRGGADRHEVNQEGLIAADGGTVLLSAADTESLVENVINVGGRIRANAVKREGGTVTLFAAGPSAVTVSGSIEATGLDDGQSGGVIEAVAETVTVTETARLDASGAEGGGAIRLGGGVQGTPIGLVAMPPPSVPAPPKPKPKPKPTAVPARTATVTRVAEGASLRADATQAGDGGQVVLWSEDVTVSEGALSARGGRRGGDGGFIETSSRHVLHVAGRVDAGAPRGATGQWLLDPDDITIDVGATSGGSFDALDPNTYTATPAGGGEGRFGGEALSGLARSFFHAGARGLVVSHWQVDSQATRTLMATTFRLLAVGGTSGTAEALQQTQRRMIANPRQAHPFFWGAFTLVGDGRARITAADNTNP